MDRCLRLGCHGIRDEIDNIFCPDCRQDWRDFCEDTFGDSIPTELISRPILERFIENRILT